jgi:hypothetical protein
MGTIDEEQVERLARSMNNEYGAYLLKILRDPQER